MIHVEFDIPAEKYGDLVFLAPTLRIENMSHQPNVVRPKKGEVAGKQNGASIKDVIIQTLQKHHQANWSLLREEVKKAGFTTVSISTYLDELIKAKVIRRVDRGVYSTVKALPAPSKKAS